MDYKHLFWIIPICIFIGMVLYSMLTQETNTMAFEGWVSCIEELYELK